MSAIATAYGDTEVFAAIRDEEARQRNNIELIASENLISW